MEYVLLYTSTDKVGNALLAQLDRVTGYEPVGQGFESLTARQVQKSVLFVQHRFLYYVWICQLFRKRYVSVPDGASAKLF